MADATNKRSDTLTALVQQAQQGDEEAFRAVYRQVNPDLLRYVTVIVGSQDAEDVVAETWLQLARDLPRFDGDGAAFRRFALTVARNRARDLARRRGRRATELTTQNHLLPEPRSTQSGGASDVAEIVGTRLSTQDALAIIRSLPRSQAEAVILRVILGLGTKDAACVLGKRPGAVAMALARGLRTLARAYGDGNDEGGARHDEPR
ncbi:MULTISPECIES: RNA polymerase sigma factor [unclassified Streptomyces]|uniref:RNA polymerase sigma factor n=1 Tax=unclassified Streptomyces TaxID=2593676 RepID=UPI0022B72D7B|nr:MULTISPECIES: RNA polymerase sigma factor [unclassified Streptomyces]MCZ7416980.1 RNA polymerase sigma factor [Streptomyces sp. WMMC897]MCZ7433190.1 RNA polymerase sigma factor [Streptomyces sp. WMMC1477]